MVVSMDHRAVSNVSFCSAIMFVVSAMFYVWGFTTEFSAQFPEPTMANVRDRLLNRTAGEERMERYMALDPEILRPLWTARAAALMPYLLAEFSAAVAWAMVIPTVLSTAAVLGGHRSSSTAFSGCFIACAIISLINFTYQGGTVTVTDWISTWPSMQSRNETDPTDNEGTGFGPLQALEINFLISNSRTLWLFCMDELLVSIGLAFAAWLVCTGNNEYFGKCWAAYSILVSVFSLCGFFVNIFRMVRWREFGVLAGAMTAIIDAFFLPVWIVWLAFILRQASPPGPSYMTSGHMVDPKAGGVEMSAASTEGV